MAVSDITNRIRLTGLASGLDVDKIVSDLMKAERIPLDKAKQQEQLLEWKRDDYRSIISLLSDFNKAYLDIANPATNMTSASTYKKFSTSITDQSGQSSSIFTAVCTAGASAGNNTVIVKQLATAATEVSSGNVTAPLTTGSLTGTLALNGKKMTINLDGTVKEITFNADYNITSQADGEAFAAELQSLINNAFGQGLEDPAKPGTYLNKINVTYNSSDGKITFATGGGSNRLTITSGSSNDALSTLGMTSGASNRLDTSKTLLQLKDSFNVAGGLTFYNDDGVDKVKFTINGKEFSFTSDTKLSTVLNTINSDATAGVNIAYDALNDRFSISSKKTGAGQGITITNTWGNLFGAESAFNIDPSVSGFGSNGKDAIVNINGQDLVYGQNTFTEGGITYSLLKADPAKVNTLTVTADTNAIYDNIKNFINKYNEVIDKIYTKLNEKYDRDYPPLTDDQKENMKEDDIKKWEEKAKTGLLRNDPILQRLYDSLRMAVIEPISGENGTLSSIGISSLSYTDYGKLTIDEQKLKNAIQNDPDGVMKIFAKQSETLPAYDRKATPDKKAARYDEEGIAQRIYDIVQDNISIVTDSDKRKGYLIEKAGLAGDTSDLTSSMALEIKSQLEKIDALNTKLADKEEQYYKKFTAMEVALSQLNSQSSWIASQLSSYTSNT